MNKDKRREIMALLSEAFPNPKSELEFTSPFELLVAVVLAAQATDKSVNIATRNLYPIANTPQAIFDLGEEKLTEYIRHIGLYRNKAKNVIALCRRLLDEYEGEVPRDLEKLKALPGVGQKTASVVMNVAFQAPLVAVDTHVFRVANRTGYAKGTTPEEVQEKMERYTAAEYLLNAHHYFILLGRYTCKAKKPECWRCPIAGLCEYKEKSPEPQPKVVRQMRPGT
jgi:endonuclease-3